METKHTPTPWRIAGNAPGFAIMGPPRQHERMPSGFDRVPSDLVAVVPCDSGHYYHYPANIAEANAAFIVRACNSHDALVEALEELTRQEDWEGEDTAPGSPIGKARAALKLARGEA